MENHILVEINGSQKMLRRILSHLFNAAILFCVISFFSVFITLLSRKGTQNPTANIGFPLKYYEQFWLDKNDLHWGWNFKNFIIDAILVLILVILVKAFQTRKNKSA
jgi:hypothetical protein